MTKNIVSTTLLNDLKQIIETTKKQVAHYANSSLVMLYWSIGDRINKDVLKQERGGYGEQVVKQLSAQLVEQYGSGFDRPNLSRMLKFNRFYPDNKICVTLSHKLSWSQFVRLIAIEDPLKRDFYTEMCQLEGWTVRALRRKINSMLYERTALSKHPEPIIKAEIEKLKQGDLMNPDLYLQDPYILSFLHPYKISNERDLEETILNELQAFIQEMGSDFCFVDRQKRMSTLGNDRYLDLLFFHRGMKKLIAIELKMSTFQPEHAGQMEWYLKWLDKYERHEGEEKPLGIIICAGKDQEDVELLELDKTGIHVAQYLAELPPRKLLQERLHQAILIAREKHNQRLSLKDKK